MSGSVLFWVIALLIIILFLVVQTFLSTRKHFHWGLLLPIGCLVLSVFRAFILFAVNEFVISIADIMFIAGGLIGFFVGGVIYGICRYLRYRPYRVIRQK